ncbi:MAG: hypothetical protein R2940_02520 [Syntrophotaleaceae bacterium]
MRCIKKRKNRTRGKWLQMSMLVMGVFLCSANSYGGNSVESLYNINDATTFKPEEYIVKGSNLSLFPVPQDNAVGTNDMGNAITLLSFHNGKPRADKYFRNAAHNFEGGGTYLPVIDENTIGFAQSRRFLLFDFNTRDCKDYRIVMSLEKTIEKVAIADALKKKFIFEIQEHNLKSQDPWDYTNHLLLVDLTGDEPKIIREINIGRVTGWISVIEKIFLYNIKAKQMEVLGMDLVRNNHPLADIINKNKDEFDFSRIQPHPYLPFSILEAGTKDEVIVSWRAGSEVKPISMFGPNTTVTQFSFSPDGKWVVFENETSLDKKKTYLMPVSEKYPNYLGSPILLANDYFDEGRFAWTTNPISFIGSSLNKLYRWELTNEAHPESDKPTFHEYIVEKDLEKLTREMKQGLGGKSD